MVTIRRRRLLIGLFAGLGALATGTLFRRRIRRLIARWTRLKSFTEPPPKPTYAAGERATVHVAQGQGPSKNLDRVLDALGGLQTLVNPRDVVIIKVNAQWWNQGMTNVAAVRRLIERILALPHFDGEIIVFENCHFRLADGSGLARAWTRPSVRNVDVPGWTSLGDLVRHPPFVQGPVSFVGLVDAGGSALSGDAWRDPDHAHGVYGGDNQGPIQPGETRDGYHWDLDAPFECPRSRIDAARTPLTWPVFTSPRSGLVIDLKRGVLQRQDDRLVPADRELTWIVMSGANEHTATGITGACKSLMGVVDMSAGRLGTHPSVQAFEAVHFFGAPDAMWRMAGPLADFTQRVRAPDLYLAVAEWAGITPKGGLQGPDDDPRLHLDAAFHANTVVAGTDPVAVDTWCVQHLLMPHAGERAAIYNLDNPKATVTAFLRYWRQVSGRGVLDPARIDVV